MINKLSVELEGGFNLKLASKLADIGIKIRPDGSVSSFEDCEYKGEISNPPDSLDGVLKFIDNYYPTRVNHSCGQHIHVSFTNKLDYMQLMTKKFYDHFIKSIKDWGLSQTIPNGDQFWIRLNGIYHSNDMFCPDQQINGDELPTGVSSRYAHLNFCWRKHGTIECRLLPMFADKELSKKAITLIHDIYKNYLESHKPREPNYKLDIVDDSPIILNEVIINCV